MLCVMCLVVRPDSRATVCKVTKVARLLAAKTCNVMALLDGGMLKRQKSWVKVSNHFLVDFYVCHMHT
jgi:hypothetical protein